MASRRETATRDELNKRLLSLEVQLEKANERAKSDNPLTSGIAEATANRLTNDIMRLQDRLDAMGKSTRAPKRPPEIPDSGRVYAAPRPRSITEGKELAARAAERRYGSGPDAKKPSPVDTQSKKPIAKRIMEALGDNRSMEQATRDRKMTAEMERETMGRKKGGMAKKKKAPVKKASGGMVKKKQGGSARKVNMKAGFTRRGCSKG
jgi:hypothetical protein